MTIAHGSKTFLDDWDSGTRTKLHRKGFAQESLKNVMSPGVISTHKMVQGVRSFWRTLVSFNKFALRPRCVYFNQMLPSKQVNRRRTNKHERRRAPCTKAFRATISLQENLRAFGAGVRIPQQNRMVYVNNEYFSSVSWRFGVDVRAISTTNLIP